MKQVDSVQPGWMRRRTVFTFLGSVKDLKKVLSSHQDRSLGNMEDMIGQDAQQQFINYQTDKLVKKLLKDMRMRA